MSRTVVLATTCIAVLGARVAAQPAVATPAPAPPDAGSASTTASPGGGAAQLLTLEGEKLPDYDKIRTPDSPAFTLLGVSPTQIERPTTPKKLTAVLSKFVSEGDAVIPKNLAVELSPYGLISSGDDVDLYQHRGALTQLWQNITVSLATAASTREVADEMGVATTHTDSTLGIGVRTSTTLSGAPAYTCSKDELNGLVELSKSEAVSSAPDGIQLQREMMTELMRPGVTEADRAVIVQKYQARLTEQKRKPVADSKLASLCIKELGSVHRGWIMDVAAASGFTFVDSAAKDGRYSLGAVWIDAAYEADHASVVLLARGRDDKTTGRHDYFSDLGVRGILAKDAYAASVELIWRHAIRRSNASTADDDAYRIALALDVHVTDKAWVTLSFGRDFASSAAGSLFSLANLKYGLGDPKVKVR